MRHPVPPPVIVITGGSSGIGLATALLFARRGWRIGLIARSQACLNAAECRLIELGARVCPVSADVTDPAALDSAASQIEQRLGPIEAWVNAAGTGVFGQLAEVPPHEFDRVTATTYTGTVNGVRVALRHMTAANTGRIVNVCSAMAFRGLPGLSSYAGAKAAVRGFTESVQTELKLARSNIRLSIIYPPAVNTPFFAHAVSYLRLPPRPARPVYQPELIAEGIWLAVRTGTPVMRVSFITVLFDLACRLAPGLVGAAIGQLGYDGQMTDLPEALDARDPSLFAPPLKIAGVHGPFSARSVSTQLWLTRNRTSVALGAAGIAAVLLGSWLSHGRNEPLGRLPHARSERRIRRPAVG
jgi:NAD(P)-dependent dehydrogenase (short-subunit alcohol dehydrogenase family)